MTELYKTHKVLAKPLRFHNKFRSTGYAPPRARVGNSKIAFFSGNPNTTTSPEERDRMRDLLLAKNRQHAGIFTEKEKLARQFKRLASKAQKKKLEKYLIQYLAAADLEDGIPNYIPLKYRRDAAKLHNRIRTALEEVQDKIKQNKLDAHRIDAEDLVGVASMGVLKKEAPELWPTLMALADKARQEYVDNDLEITNIDFYPELPESGNSESPYAYDRDEEKMDELLNGSGVFLNKPTKHLFQRIREMPFARKEETPEEQVKEQQSEHEKRQEKYKEEQKEARGAPPPREMVNRAMPDKVEPVKYVTGISSIVMAPFKLKRKSHWV